ncbi:MAG: hypothetical protein KAT30_01700, partial [Candidatus Krumholzibacteria bacterium]|nr:hypothetical protein [Candidatus Krumholzibacteria bacterium]
AGGADGGPPSRGALRARRGLPAPCALQYDRARAISVTGPARLRPEPLVKELLGHDTSIELAGAVEHRLGA